MLVAVVKTAVVIPPPFYTARLGFIFSSLLFFLLCVAGRDFDSIG
jgi:hypothetical protein